MSEAAVPANCETNAQVVPTITTVEEERKVFKCSMCNLFARYDYFGTKPLERHATTTSKTVQQNPKKETIILIEPAYVCDDPFSELKSNNYLILGAKCNICNKMTCVSSECSVFYFKKRFCFKCAAQCDQNEFPSEIQIEIKKYLDKQNL